MAWVFPLGQAEAIAHGKITRPFAEIACMASQRLPLPRFSQFPWASLTQPNPGKKVIGLWLALSFSFGLLYSGLALHHAFADPFIVQDDARQHVFWMQRFLDPELFPNDLIADYFQSVDPWGYRLLYQLGAWLHIAPFSLNKFLPLPITLIVTFYCFRLTLALLPVPFTAFTSTILLNQAIWVNSDVSSATPRAFIYPILAAFLYYLVEGKLLPCLATLLLQGLFYPQTLLLSLGVLTLGMLRWQPAKPLLQKLAWADRSQRRFSLIALAGALSILVIYALQSSTYGPTITKAEALQMPEFWPGGRSSFFSDNFFQYWLQGRSGLVHRKLFTPATQALGLLLPFFFLGKPRFALLKQTQKLGVLTQLTLSSIGMFFLAHAVLFKLHLPSRYVQHSLRIVLAVAAAMVITSWIDALIRWAPQGINSTQRFRRSLVSGCVIALLLASVVLYPLTLKRFLASGYVTVGYPSFHQFFAQQPKDSLLASLSREADNVGSIAARSVWVSWEHSIPYHTGYYLPLRDRLQRLIAAQYAPDLATVQSLIRKEGITHWLLDGKSFNLSELADDDWLLQYQPEMNNALASLQAGQVPALNNPKLQQACSVYNAEGLLLLSADCLLQQPEP
jgi:hypothetical protein